jgi:hypothetical protein
MYYVMINEEVSGPHEMDQIAVMLQEGTILPITLAVEEGHQNWMALEKLVDIRIDRSSYPISTPEEHQEEEHHEHHHGPSGTKKCPFCGNHKIKSVSKELNYSTSMHLFSPKVCKSCHAIWTPKVPKASAMQVLFIGIGCICAALVFLGPEIAYIVGAKPTRMVPAGPALIVGWILSCILCIGGGVAFAKSLRYLRSENARAFKVLRRPHLVSH